MATNLTPPTDWNSGFTAPHRPATDEVPFLVNGRWYLYVYNSEKRDQDVFSYSEDRFYTYAEFQQMMDNMRTSGAIRQA